MPQPAVCNTIPTVRRAERTGLSKYMGLGNLVDMIEITKPSYETYSTKKGKLKKKGLGASNSSAPMFLKQRGQCLDLCQ